MKKLPSKLSTEDLLKALENSETEETNAIEESIESNNDVPQFLMHYGIEAGEHVVTRKHVYSLYCRFSKQPIGNLSFGQEICKYVESHAHAYYLNKHRSEIAALINKVDNRGWAKYNPAHPNTRKHFEQFMDDVGLRNGDRWIPSYMLIMIYKKWCLNNKKSIRFKDKSFIKICSLFLEYKRGMKVYYYFKVPQTAIDYLTPEEIRMIENDRKTKLDQNRKKKQKQTNKKKRRVPGVNTFAKLKDKIR